MSIRINGEFAASLSQEIQKEFNALMEVITHISNREIKNIEFTGGYVSVADSIGYQIGWGKRVIEWYDTGVAGKTITMPGDGFDKWSYVDIARSFYKSYAYDAGLGQEQIFCDTTKRIIEIAETEFRSGNLDKEGVWPWQQLSSGKWWPLSKWIRVNTVAPFKRVRASINKFRDVLMGRIHGPSHEK